MEYENLLKKFANNSFPIKISLFTLNQAEGFQTFSALKMLRLECYVLVSFMNLRALDAIPATYAKSATS